MAKPRKGKAKVKVTASGKRVSYGQALIDCYKKPGGIIYNHKKFLKDVTKKASERRKKEMAKDTTKARNPSKSSVRVSQPLAPTQFNN